MTKYRAQKTVIDGITFASKREAVFYVTYRTKEQAGLIRELTLQPKFPLIYDDKPILGLPAKDGRRGKKLAFFADFSFVDVDTGKRHIVDVKGVDTPISRLKRALIKAMYDIDVEIVK